MFGKNPVVKKHLDPDGQLKVHSIFRTIQGEGPNAGLPAIFVRLADCNLRCFWCDTEFAQGEYIQVEELAREIIHMAEGAINLVVITGGEPLLQNLVPLARRLDKAKFLIQVETAGTVWVPFLPYWVELVCSPKTAVVAEEIALFCRHWKYIIRAGEVDPKDGLPVYSTQVRGRKTHLYRGHGTIWVQPMDEQDPDRNRANLEEALRSCYAHGYRLSFQVHKAIGVE